MAQDWESTLRQWVKPSSDAEESKRDRTETEIRLALANYPQLPNAAIRVFVQGSYKNRTNVRLDYDVDIAVEYQEGESLPTTTPGIASTLKAFAAKDLSSSDLGLTTLGTFDPAGFKDHVEAAMVAAFGRSKVIRGPKCIKIKNGSTTLPADVVPCFPLRRYDSRGTAHRGIRIWPDSGATIDNYPDRHYSNGCAKNDRTSRRYKRMVRALKRMKSELLTKGRIAKEVPSFFMECLVYNVPDSLFGSDSYLTDFSTVMEHIWFKTYDPTRCAEWEEVSGLNYLFRGNNWTPAQAEDLAWEAWQAVKGGD